MLARCVDLWLPQQLVLSVNHPRLAAMMVSYFHILSIEWCRTCQWSHKPHLLKQNRLRWFLIFVRFNAGWSMWFPLAFGGGSITFRFPAGMTNDQCPCLLAFTFPSTPSIHCNESAARCAIICGAWSIKSQTKGNINLKSAKAKTVKVPNKRSSIALLLLFGVGGFLKKYKAEQVHVLNTSQILTQGQGSQ